MEREETNDAPNIVHLPYSIFVALDNNFSKLLPSVVTFSVNAMEVLIMFYNFILFYKWFST